MKRFSHLLFYLLHSLVLDNIQHSYPAKQCDDSHITWNDDLTVPTTWQPLRPQLSIAQLVRTMEIISQYYRVVYLPDVAKMLVGSIQSLVTQFIGVPSSDKIICYIHVRSIVRHPCPDITPLVQDLSKKITATSNIFATGNAVRGRVL